MFFVSFENSGVLRIFCNGILYAERPFIPSQKFKVNIPFKGNYYFKNNDCKLVAIKPLERTILNIDLPIAERDKTPLIRSFSSDNESKSPARIYTDIGKIVINDRFKNYPIEVRMFILLHEYGHFYYKTEHKCDEFAAFHFCDMGFNPSQAFESLAGVLHDSETNNERINKVYNLLKKQN